MKTYPSQQELHAALRYDPETGKFTRDGKPTGSVSTLGYEVIGLHGQRYMAHVLAWIYVHGIRPEVVDHKNLQRADNRIANLRSATRGLNRANSKPNEGKTTKGVRKDPRCHNRFAAVLCGKHIGMFGSEQEAYAAYLDAAKQRFGEFARAEGANA